MMTTINDINPIAVEEAHKLTLRHMKYEINECCDCATEPYPCVGNSCFMRHVVYYQCDRCGCGGLTEDEIHEVDGEDLCDTCFDEEFKDDSL